MRPLRLVIVVILVLPVLLLGWLTSTEHGLNWAYQKAELYLPFDLHIDKLEGRLIGPLTVEGFEYQQDGLSIHAGRITIDWLPSALLTASIDVNELQVHSLDIVLPKKEDDTEAEDLAATQTIVLPEIHLPWRLLLRNAELNDINISQDGQAFKVNKVKIDASTLFSKINIKHLDIHADTLNLDIKGKLHPTRDYRHELSLNWQLTLPSSEILTGKGKLTGDMKNTRIQQNLSGPLQLTLNAELADLLEQLKWTVKANIKQFDISRLGAGWPALNGAANLNGSGDLSTAALTGNMQGTYPELGKLNADFDIQRLTGNVIRINRLQLLAPENDTRINASGSWMPGEITAERDDDKDGGSADNSNLKLALDWKNLRWPGQGTPWFNSAVGSGTIEGNIHRYQLILDSDSPWPQAAPSTWHASATGDLAGMEIQSLRITALDGEADINGRINWSEELNWQAKGNIRDVNPARLLPQWPGQLNGKLSSEGSMHDGKLIIHADIDKLSGQLRGHPVSLQSGLTWRDETLEISELNYFSGKSQVQLDGQVGEKLDLNWTVNSADLEELYPLSKGQLQATGQLKGAARAPLVKVSVNGKDLAYTDYEMASIEGRLAVELSHWQQIDIQLAMQGFKVYDTELRSVNIDADNQTLTLQAASNRITANIELEGQADTKGWRGRIEKVDIQSQHYENWQLESPAALSFDKTTLQLNNLCLHSSQQANACMSLKRGQDLWHSSAKINSFPLKLFERWMPQDLKLEGKADGKADIEYRSSEALLAHVDIVFPPGTVNYPMLSGEKDQRIYKTGHIKIVLDPQGLTAASELSMANGDHFTGDLKLPGFSLLSATDKTQTLTAQAKVQANDLRLIETLIPDIYDLQGKLDIRLTASGTLDQPVLSGTASLVDGNMKIPGLGLDIKQLNFHSEAGASNLINYRLSARSGDGKLNITGQTRLDHDTGWPTEISISGNDFEASHIPEARLNVSPDLHIKIKNRSIDVRGKVHIPYAKLQPKDITLAKNVSSDTVIIDSQQPTEEKWLIRTSVRLTLGERVHFYGYGFEGRLGGNLLLEDEPGQLTKATGEITIPEGTYRAYGQRLEVENGRILYTGSPLTNPGLDVRAVRKVDNVTAGIHVKGTLNQPKLEIFSNPAMGQTDALAYLLLGGPIENASNEDGEMIAKAALALGLSGGDSIARSLADRFGLDDMRVESSNKGDQAALVVGRYLSPEIYVSYGVGLIERVDTLTLRYQIARKWQLKVESGAYQGADILYTIER
jgi:translocation and assembly module TamB